MFWCSAVSLHVWGTLDGVWEDPICLAECPSEIRIRPASAPPSTQGQSLTQRNPSLSRQDTSWDQAVFPLLFSSLETTRNEEVHPENQWQSQ